MRKSLLLISLFILPFLLNAQVLKAKVYDAETTVKGVKIFNESQKRLTASDENGLFSIQAKINDTLFFESLFHHPKVVILEHIHFEGTTVFELKKIINELEEVELKSEPEQPVFTEQSYNTNLQNLIKEDIKNNPHLYQPAGATYGVDFVYLIGQVIKLFKGKDKNRASLYHPISYQQLDSLTTHSSFFNDKLLTQNLKIPKDKKYLFLEFLEAKQISSELLKDNNKMQLLEKLVQNSRLFLILLEQYGEDKTSKD